MSAEEIYIRLLLMRVQITRDVADFPFNELQSAMPKIALNDAMEKIWIRLGHY